MASSSRANINDVVAFLSGGTVSNNRLREELAQLEDTEFSSDEEGDAKGDNPGSSDEDNGAVEDLLANAYSIQGCSASAQSPSEHCSLLLLDPEISDSFDGK